MTIEIAGSASPSSSVAIALSGGGARGAVQVGMLRALIERGIMPDMVIGASAGAVNGAWYALHPDRLDALEGVWLSLTRRGVFPGTIAHNAYNFMRHGHVHRSTSWQRILRNSFGEERIEDAPVPLTLLTVRLADGEVIRFQSGTVVPVLMASTAVPGLFPPQRLNGDIHVDGAVVEFLPIPTAVDMGATRIYALDCSAYPEGDGRSGLTMDRAAQIAATAWVRLVINEAHTRGVEVIRLRPPLSEVMDGRDFSQTRKLIRSGFEYASSVLADIPSSQEIKYG